MSDPHEGHRCAWAASDPQMRAYHDTEWGVPERDSRALWCIQCDIRHHALH